MPDDAVEESEETPLLSHLNNSALSFSDQDEDTVSSHSLRPQTSRTARLASSYRRPSFVSGGGRGFLLSSDPVPDYALRDDEAFECVREERDLLKRNSIGVPGVGIGRRGSGVAAAVAVEEVEETWEEAVKGGKIKTSWRYELGVMSRYSVSLRYLRHG
jgi:hypothetical protein